MASPDVAPLRPVTTAYGAISLIDPYRYFEDAKDPVYLAWRDAHVAQTRDLLDHLPKLDAVRQAAAGHPPVRRPTGIARGGGYLFYERPTATGKVIVVRDVRARTERVLAGEDRFASGTTHAAFGAFAASPDGKFLAVHVYLGDALDSDMRIIRVADGRDADAPLHHTVYDDVQFTPDDTELLYAAPADAAAERGPLLGNVILQRVHRMGQPQRSDVAAFGPGVSSRVDVPRKDFAFIDVPDGSNHMVAEVRDAGAGGARYYEAPLRTLGKPNTPWRLLGSEADRFSDEAVHGDTIDLVSARDAPNYCVVRASLSGPFRPRTILPTSDHVVVSGTLDGIPKGGIFALNPAADADYVQLLDGGHDRMTRIPYGEPELPHDVALPVAGTVLEAATMQRDSGIDVDLTSWTSPGDVFRYDPQAGGLQALGIVSPDASGDRVAQEVSATAADGTAVPVSVVRERTTPLDGTSPVMLTVIGGYGFSTTPDYDRVPAEWLALGGIYAVAHVRGGGEFGEAWHRAGMGAKKPASWTDLVAAAQMLVDRGYTTAGRIDLLGNTQSYIGGAAPAIAIGRALEERPQLFGAAVFNAPVFDTVRSETTPTGKISESEFGTVATQDGFAAIEAMSPYDHVADGTRYPAVLARSLEAFQIGDDWQAAKFVARLRAANSRNAAYLDRVGADPADRRTPADLHIENAAFFLWANGMSRAARG